MEILRVNKTTKQLQRIEIFKPPEFLGLKCDARIVAQNSEWIWIDIHRTARGRGLKKPIRARIPIPNDTRKRLVYAWIIDSLTHQMTSLVPFAFENQSILGMAKWLHKNTSRGWHTICQYVYAISRFSSWAKRSPDDLIGACMHLDGLPNLKAIQEHENLLDNWTAGFEIDGLEPTTISCYVKGVKSLYATNKVPLNFRYRIGQRAPKDRAPRPDELAELVYLTDLCLRDRFIVACLALGGFREGTLVKLKYHHVKEDLERGIIPVHVHVEAGITKGKYGDYDTFIGKEAVDLLVAYLDSRRRGTPRLYIPPEKIQGNSPLIRTIREAQPKPLSETGVYHIVRRALQRAGKTQKAGRRYKLTLHSIRKFFRTQLAALGVDRDYIEFMMGHKVSTYHDIQMKGVEFLRNIYTASGLSIKPKTKVSKIEALKEIIRAWGMNPEEILTKKALSQPHRVYATPYERQENHVKALRHALKEMMRKELLNQKHRE